MPQMTGVNQIPPPPSPPLDYVPTPPQVPVEQPPEVKLEENKNRWRTFLNEVKTNSALQQALVRFGTTLAQPAPPGQTHAGQFGTAIQSGMDTYTKVQGQEAASELEDKRLKLQEREVVSGEEQVGINKKKQISEEEVGRAQAEELRAHADERRKGKSSIGSGQQKIQALANAWIAVKKYDDPNEAYVEAALFYKSAATDTPEQLYHKTLAKILEYDPTFIQTDEFEAIDAEIQKALGVKNPKQKRIEAVFKKDPRMVGRQLGDYIEGKGYEVLNKNGKLEGYADLP